MELVSVIEDRNEKDKMLLIARLKIYDFYHLLRIVYHSAL